MERPRNARHADGHAAFTRHRRSCVPAGSGRTAATSAPAALPTYAGGSPIDQNARRRSFLSLLPLFSAVAEFISAFGGIHKDYAIKKVLCLFNQSLFNMIKTFLESNAPEVTEMLENIQLYTSKILVLIDLNTILKSRK